MGSFQTAVFGVALVILSPLIPSSLAQTQGNPENGKLIYEKRCASCHGKKGEGMPFLPHIPNLSDTQYMAGKSDAELLDTIANGKKGTPMQSWKGVLTEQDQRDVLAYIRTFSTP